MLSFAHAGWLKRFFFDILQELDTPLGMTCNLGWICLARLGSWHIHSRPETSAVACLRRKRARTDILGKAQSVLRFLRLNLLTQLLQTPF